MDETLSIADSATPEDAQVAKLRVYVRERYAAMCKPKKWGTKAGDINVTSTVNNFLVVTEQKRAELIERRQKLLAS